MKRGGFGSSSQSFLTLEIPPPNCPAPFCDGEELRVVYKPSKPHGQLVCVIGYVLRQVGDATAIRAGRTLACDAHAKLRDPILRNPRSIFRRRY